MRSPMPTVGVLVLCLFLAACSAIQPLAPVSPTDRVAAPNVPSDPLAGGVLLLQYLSDGGPLTLHRIDPATGEPYDGYAPIQLAPRSLLSVPHVVSPSGRYIAVVAGQRQSCEPYAGGGACRAAAETLYLIDAASWTILHSIDLEGNGWTKPLAFDASDTRFAMALHTRDTERILLFDVPSGSRLAEAPVTIRPSFLSFVPGASVLVAYGPQLGSEPGITQPEPPRVVALDGETLRPKWERILPDVIDGDWCTANCTASHEERQFAYLRPAVIMAPDGSKLYIIHAESDRLSTVSLSDGAAHSLTIRPVLSWVETLLALTAKTASAKGAMELATRTATIAPDGSQLYVATHYDRMAGVTGSTTELRRSHLQRIESNTGQIAAEAELAGDVMALTLDGTRLLLYGWSEQGAWAELRTAADLAVETRASGWLVSASASPRSLLLASRSVRGQSEVAMLDPATLSPIHTWQLDGYVQLLELP